MNSIVPIRALGAQHRERVANHLLALTERDRYLRFGYSASDEQVRRYAELLDFERDEVFGIFNRRLQLIAMAHVAYAQSEDTQSCAEFGVSVLASARGRGYGGLLFDRAMTENTAMMKRVLNAAAVIHQDGTESKAYLQVPPAGLDTRMSKIVAEHFGEVDYQLKKQARQFWSLLADMQEIRQGVQDGRHQAAE